MLKKFLSTAAVLALMAGPAYAQSGQAGTGSAGSTTTEKPDTGSAATSTGASGSGSAQSDAGASSSSGSVTTGQDSGAASTSGGTMTTGQGSGAASTSSDTTTTTQDSSGTAASGAAATSGSGETFLTDQSDGQWRAEKLIGASVKNAEDEDIGKINDLVFSEEGQIQAAVVSVGGFLGIGAKNVALNWDQLQIRSSEAGEEIMVSMTKEQLENAPAFKTLEDKKSEEAAANAQMQQGTTPPATGMGTSN